MIKMLIMTELGRLHISWELFLKGLGRKPRVRVIFPTNRPRHDGKQTPAYSTSTPGTSAAMESHHHYDTRASKAPTVPMSQEKEVVELQVDPTTELVIGPSPISISSSESDRLEDLQAQRLFSPEQQEHQSDDELVGLQFPRSSSP
jgi:hypothetical protein